MKYEKPNIVIIDTNDSDVITGSCGPLCTSVALECLSLLICESENENVFSIS